MPFETTLLREFPIAVPTLEGFLVITSMGLHVCVEMTLPSKFSIAMLTLERLLTSVGPQVAFQTTLSRKFLITVPTLERFLTRVGPHVPIKMVP